MVPKHPPSSRQMSAPAVPKLSSYVTQVVPKWCPSGAQVWNMRQIILIFRSQSFCAVGALLVVKGKNTNWRWPGLKISVYKIKQIQHNSSYTNWIQSFHVKVLSITVCTSVQCKDPLHCVFCVGLAAEGWRTETARSFSQTSQPGRHWEQGWFLVRF